ncbi:hypothetical protein QJS10_CPA05g00584 [Acorus calamus]|uniref:DOCKER domain-containing protein n=1 Tax=Acorus calamus TaxID=4465 RepID=A0AAV9EU34_ACOCL|nr:hypothetical protein QJS10_CPA05g00584 [Acorus calamus]
MEDLSAGGHRFRRIPRHSLAANLELDPLLNENLEQWPHLNELVQCYKADWVKDESKYGHYESIPSLPFQSQIFEGPDTDLETEIRLANARSPKNENFVDDDLPSTSGRHMSDVSSSYSGNSSLHFGESPLPAYEPAFDWENERSSIFGQRTPEAHPAQYWSGLKISVKVLSLSFQAGLFEPFYGTICLYNKERREKMSEDFYFRVLPTEMQEASGSSESQGIFTLDTPSASVCLLIQLEKPATEEGGVTPSVYSRKEPVHLTEREKQKLQVWSRIMPYKESFAWAIVPLFESSSVAAAGGATSPSSPLVPSISGSSSLENVIESVPKVSLDGKLAQYSCGSSVVVEISNLNKVKESYTEDSLQDPKRKVHKPVKGTLKLEVEKFHLAIAHSDNFLESGSVANDSIDIGDRNAESAFTGSLSNGSDGVQNGNAKWNSVGGREVRRNGPSAFVQNHHVDDKLKMKISIVIIDLDSWVSSLSRKRNLFVRVELRKDDVDLRKQPLEAMYPRSPGSPGAPLQRSTHTQLAIGARVIVGYAALPLSAHAQLHSEISLPIMRELSSHYLQDGGKERMDFLEDGKNVFRLRLRLCSSLYPLNERIKDFFLEYDRHTLRTSPPWGSELLEAINSLKNVDSTALIQFLQPILNMLLHLIGDGGETLQVAAFRAMVNILTRVQQESSDAAVRNRFLVNYVDYAFDDFGGRQPPVYPGLSSVWGSLARSKVSLYMDKFAGVCPSVLHDCKLTFLQIICDHDLFVEMPGRDPSDRYCELFLTWDHDDLSQRAKAARILVVLMCKHEFDTRYQKQEDKLYIAQLYFPLIGQILDEMPVFYNLNAVEKREVLIVIVQIIRNLDDASLIKAWQQNIARTRLFFKLFEECLALFEHRKPADSMLLGCSSRSIDGEGPVSPKFSDRLSPAVNTYLSEASRQELRVRSVENAISGHKKLVIQKPPQSMNENGYLWHGASPLLSSPSQPYSLREALAQAQSSRIGSSTRALRESLHPILRQKLELWEESLSAAVSLQVLEIIEKFSVAAASHTIATDYDGKLDCITSIFMSFFSRSQPLAFWKALFPVFNNILVSMSSFYYFMHTTRLRVMLTITLSELMSDVQVTQMKPDGSLEESGEARRLRKSLEEMADEARSSDLIKECRLPANALQAVPEGSTENRWSWQEVRHLSDSLLQALDAGLEHALLGSVMGADRYAAAESFYKLAMAYAPVPDLHIMWLLHLCDAHQEMQSWAEAAQCAVAVAGVVMQALVGRNDAVWSRDHVSSLRKICPMVSSAVTGEASAAEVEGYGASKLTVDSAVKYLQLANKLFSQAELYHFCASILELIIPVYKSRRAFGQLAKCHTSLTEIYESILEQEASPIPFIDATYYRVGFYGDRFGKLDKKEYVYREPRDVRLGDIMEKLSHIYESRMDGNHTLHIIPDSRQVNADELQPGVCYLQITAVDPVMEDEDLGSRRERIFSLSTGSMRARVFDRFLFDTPFTKNGKSQGGLEDQWKRRTVLQTEGSFPALVNRLLVVKSESLEFSPVENAIGMIETRTAALRNELEEPRSSEGDQLPRLQSLQRILQGSVAVQVNSGVLSVCTAFLSGEPATRLRSQELQQLIAALLEFMAVCKRAIRVHIRLIGEEDQDFHTQLVNGFQSLTAELSHYIPAILSEL